MTVKLKIARVSTVPFFMDNQLSGQIEYLINQEHQVFVVTSPDGDWGRLNYIDGLKKVPIRIHRRPAPFADFLSAVKLFCLFRREKFDVVHSYTPKAGLLCAIVARLANVPLRLHTFTGQQWSTQSGFSRWLLKQMDKIIVKLSSQSYADSFTQREFLEDERVAKDGEVTVLGKGSLAGVNLERFSRELLQPDSVRKELGLESDDVVITFVGRLNREKGVSELLDAYKLLIKENSNVHLILVGPTEDLDLDEEIRSLGKSSNLHVIGPTSVPEKYLCITDIFCLPSYREGFGTVVIEAAAMGVPTVGSDIPGLRDAVVDGETGLLVKPKDTRALYSSLQRLINDRNYCEELGRNAKMRCVKNFSSNKVSELVAEEYISLWQGVEKL